MRFDVVTIFPEMFPGSLSGGIVGKAIDRGLVRLQTHDLRRFADPPHFQVDDAPFGGGAGMLLKPEPLFRAIRQIRSTAPSAPHVVLMDPGGRPLTQGVARELADRERVVLICGRYEGVDHRVRTELVDDEISIGDYVLSGGELAAQVVMDAVSRLVPGVVGCAESIETESFERPVLDFPQYTRPAEFEGLEVPEVLLSGHHANIETWRREAAQERTRRVRPDLIHEDKEASNSNGS